MNRDLIVIRKVSSEHALDAKKKKRKNSTIPKRNPIPQTPESNRPSGILIARILSQTCRPSPDEGHLHDGGA